MAVPTNKGLIGAIFFERLDNIAARKINKQCTQQDIVVILGWHQGQDTSEYEKYIEAVEALGTRATVKVVRYPGDLSDHRMLAFLQSQPIAVSVYKAGEMVNWSQVSGILLLARKIAMECVAKYGKDRLAKIVDWVLDFLKKVPILKGWEGLMAGDHNMTENDQMITTIIKSCEDLSPTGFASTPTLSAGRNRSVSASGRQKSKGKGEDIMNNTSPPTSSSLQQHLLEAFEDFFVQRDVNYEDKAEVAADKEDDNEESVSSSTASTLISVETPPQTAAAAAVAAATVAAASTSDTFGRKKKRGGAKRNKQKASATSMSVDSSTREQQTQKTGQKKGSKSSRVKDKQSKKDQKATKPSIILDYYPFLKNEEQIYDAFVGRIYHLRLCDSCDDRRKECCQLLADIEKKCDMGKLSIRGRESLDDSVQIVMEELDCLKEHLLNANEEAQNLFLTNPKYSESQSLIQNTYRCYFTEVDSLKARAANLLQTDIDGGRKIYRELVELTQEAIKRKELLAEMGPVAFELNRNAFILDIREGKATTEDSKSSELLKLFHALSATAVALKDVDEEEANKRFIALQSQVFEEHESGRISWEIAMNLCAKLANRLQPRPETESSNQSVRGDQPQNESPTTVARPQQTASRIETRDQSIGGVQIRDTRPRTAVRPQQTVCDESADSDDGLRTIQHFRTEIEVLRRDISTLTVSEDTKSLHNRCSFLLDKATEKFNKKKLDDKELDEIVDNVDTLVSSLFQINPTTGAESSSTAAVAADEVSDEESYTSGHL